jgi:uncharacterized protein (UPF0333 family)
MKNLINDNRAVAYLLLVGVGLTIITVGIAYSFISDFVDVILSSINNYSGTPLANQMDVDSISTGNLLLALFKLILIPALLVIIYFAFTMSQKQQKSW